MRHWVFTTASLAACLSAASSGQTPSLDSGPHASPVIRSVRPAAPPLDRRVTLNLKDVTLRQALHEIDRQGHLGLAFTPRLVPLDHHVSIAGDSMTVRDALENVLRGTGVRPVVTTSETVMLIRDADLRSAVSDTGGGYALVFVHVADDTTDHPLVGAVVRINGTDMQALTPETGYAAFRRVPSGFHVITVRYLGYTPQEKTVVVPDTGYVTVEFHLKMGTAKLQEVVTTATGPRRRYELGNDITILDADSIVKHEPISNVTQILEGRVPGLTVQHTSGAPGDPSRLRIRGPGSAVESNDPIVIVDGARIYSATSDSLSANLATIGGGVVAGVGYKQPAAAPSPLDEIDPASIASIEVFKGPSATTMYGPDAANGVIVITTKRGQPGPARWTADASYAESIQPGQYPLGYYRWGTATHTGLPTICPISVSTCTADSVIAYQALNHAQYSILRPTTTTSARLGVSGGSDKLTYYVSGSLDDEGGLVALPPTEIALYQSTHDGAGPPGWMIHPQRLGRWTANSNLLAKVTNTLDVSLTSTITSENQAKSNLDRDLANLETMYIDPKTHAYWESSQGNNTIAVVPDPLPDKNQRLTDDETNFMNVGSFNWRPMHWLTTTSSLGLQTISKSAEALIPRGVSIANDSVGSLTTARGTTTTVTASLGSTATIPLPLHINMQLSAGLNYNSSTATALSTSALGLLAGTTSLAGAQQILGAADASVSQVSFGYYLAPDFTWRHIAISSGLRLDQSSSFGKNAHQPLFPKVALSWLASEEKFFPFKKLFDVFRLRAAYGQAGVWPAPSQQLRLYQTEQPYLDGTTQGASLLFNIGNSAIRPERSVDYEGGFDADILHDWVSLGFSAYDKLRHDAIMSVPVAPSVVGPTFFENIGDIRNTGLEASVTTQLIRTSLVSWNVAVDYSHNYNVVSKLGPGVVPFGSDEDRVVAGYPLFGRWARPILAYADKNHDGIIEPDEVLVGDSLVYMGSSTPEYQWTMHTNASLFRGALTVNADFLYQLGFTQVNQPLAAGGDVVFLRASADPHTPLADQASAAVLGETTYGLMQRVYSLRFNSLSVGYHLPGRWTQRLLHTQDISVSIQGTNLALFTNYKGKDPNVNANATGNETVDEGVLPQPRLWIITVHTAF